MSKKSKAPNTKKAAKAYVEWLVGLGVVEQILIAGSRSPLREKKHTRTSDWDLILVTKIKNLILADPRKAKQLHADLTIVNDATAFNKAVEIYPTDKHKVLGR